MAVNGRKLSSALCDLQCSVSHDSSLMQLHFQAPYVGRHRTQRTWMSEQMPLTISAALIRYS